MGGGPNDGDVSKPLDELVDSCRPQRGIKECVECRECVNSMFSWPTVVKRKFVSQANRGN